MRISRAMRNAVAGLSVLGLVTAMVAVATPAQAVPGLVRVTASSVSDSATTKTVSAACPAGTRVLGGGGAVVGGAGQVLITALVPVQSTNSYLVRGHEDDDGHSGSWQITAYAMCAPSPAGLEYRSVTGPLQSTTFGNYSAIQCSTNRHLLGGGGQTNGGNGDVSLEGIGAFDPYEILVLTAEDPNGYAAQWSLTAYAVCATPISGRQTVMTSTGYDSTSPKSVTVSCPSGTRVHGAGYNGGGAVSYGRWMVRSLTPNAGLTAVTLTGEEIDGGTPEVWNLTAWAVCAP